MKQQSLHNAFQPRVIQLPGVGDIMIWDKISQLHIVPNLSATDCPSRISNLQYR
jgi:hypothetical protein